MNNVRRKPVYFSVGITGVHASRGHEIFVSRDRCSDVPIALSFTQNL